MSEKVLVSELLLVLLTQKKNDSDLAVIDLSRLFPWETTRIAYNRDKYLRSYESHFIKLFQTGIADNGVTNILQ